MDDMISLDRRALIGRIALLIGASALPTDLFAAATKAATRFLPAKNYALLSALADTLVPVTDTPGALAAHVPENFDALLTNWASEESRASTVAALGAIDRRAVDSGGKGFVALAPDQRKLLLIEHDRAALKPAPRTDTVSGHTMFKMLPAVVDPGYAVLKDLILSLYYTSEIGLTQELIYEHVPGQWVPSLPITPGMRPFASPGLF